MFVKASLKKCTDSAMIMGKLNLNLTLLTLRITPELNTSYKDLSFPQGESIQNYYLENVPLQNVMVAKTKIQAEQFKQNNCKNSYSNRYKNNRSYCH